MNKKYPRDMIGYGSKKFQVKWPNNARIALQIVLNYEEGADLELKVLTSFIW